MSRTASSEKRMGDAGHLEVVADVGLGLGLGQPGEVEAERADLREHGRGEQVGLVDDDQGAAVWWAGLRRREAEFLVEVAWGEARSGRRVSLRSRD